MRISSRLLGIVVLVFIFGGTSLSSILGFWQSSSGKIPATYETGEFAGQYNPADIRGSYSLGEISGLFQVSLSDLARAFGLESNSASGDFLVKELESLYAASYPGVGTNSVRLFVALYKGLPYTPSATELLLEPAVDILKAKASLTIEETAFLDSHIAAPAPVSTPQISQSPSPTPSPEATHTATAQTVTGKTTFQDLMNWGITQDEIETAIQEKMPSVHLAVRDYASQKGLDFSVLKSSLQALVDGFPE